MTNTARVCAKCGATVFADAPRGFCSVCLFKTGLGSLDHDDDGEREPSRIQMEFGDYELLEEIGRGGEGVVYRARQKSLNRTVALKVIGLGKWSSTPHLKRFRHEAEAAASLEHPQIVPIYEIGERDGSCYFSMKFVEGGQLDQIVRREPMSMRRAAELLVKIARTVQFAHERGILHRDIKPGNILLDRHGEPHLTDFGLARLIEQESTITNSFDVLGTPSYMAPEQAAGRTKELTAAVDVYALGAVFYQMLTGQPPFAGGTTYETIRLVLETEPRSPRLWNPKVDVDLATICLKCLEKDPERRYTSALALAEDLGRWLRHEPIQARRTNVFRRGKKWLQRNPTTAISFASLIALAVTLAVIISKSEMFRSLPTTGIAVLPFENLSEDKANALFADGVQDDILTKLAKIAELKVISRTSVTAYRGSRKIQQIGRALNVSHVLEGSVRKNAGRIHLNTQLIDTRSDTHVWAEEYDRDLNDIFAVPGEIAQKVAEQLHAKVSSAEKAAIERVPTADIAAFDFYTRARNLFLGATNSQSGKQELLEAADLLNQAVQRDPSYFEAYCQVAGIHDQLYILGHDHSPGRLTLADGAINAALRLRPNAGEAHLARAANLYSDLNYDAALAELELARKSLPNDCRIPELVGLIENRRGKFEDALPELEHAMELDPRNVYRLEQIAQTYWFLRRYPEAISAFDRALAIEPNSVELRVFRANFEVDWKADTRALHEVITSIRATNPGAVQRVAKSWFACSWRKHTGQ